jgi:hypothetical protein
VGKNGRDLAKPSSQAKKGRKSILITQLPQEHRTAREQQVVGGDVSLMTSLLNKFQNERLPARPRFR